MEGTLIVVMAPVANERAARHASGRGAIALSTVENGRRSTAWGEEGGGVGRCVQTRAGRDGQTVCACVLCTPHTTRDTNTRTGVTGTQPSRPVAHRVPVRTGSSPVLTALSPCFARGAKKERLQHHNTHARHPHIRLTVRCSATSTRSPRILTVTD